ncbi:MAG: hypothetical protein H6948_03045 [Zoogloeaceae bacterium]|nr:hypothetical protein [Zoogloeaceae bacterium]
MFSWLKKNHVRNEVRAVTLDNESQSSKIALLTFEGEPRDRMLASLRSNYVQTGSYVKDGGSISKNTMLPIILGGSGAIGISSAMSGNLFMATANPATLMALGDGVTSAVVGAGGKIIAQAPFVSAAGAIIPVVAPLIAFQALMSISMARNFDAINERLDNIEKSIARLIQRSEATYVGELISAQSRLRNIEERLLESGFFTNHMQMRLSLIEHSINPIFERYHYLLDGEKIRKDMSSDDLAYRNFDALMAINTSILDLKLDVLRLKLTYQENPAFIEKSTNNLLGKVERYRSLWQGVNESIKEVEYLHEEVSGALEDLNWWQRNVSNRGRNAELSSQKKNLRILQRDRDASADSIEDAGNIADRIEGAISGDRNDKLSIVYWKDEHGEHCYYTGELSVAGNNA